MTPVDSMRADPTRTWSPQGFENHRVLFPRTAALDPGLDLECNSRFAEAWLGGTPRLEALLRPHASDLTVVFVRGFLGHYMPGNLVLPCKALRRMGFDAFIADNLPGGTVGGNVAALTRQLAGRTSRARLFFCGHSRGGLESLTLLAGNDSLSRRCAGVAMSQTAHGPSYVMESVLQGRHREKGYSLQKRIAEAVQRAGLFIVGAHAGGVELTSSRWPSLVERVDRIPWAFPVLQTASWSVRPTAWLDSFHERLGEIGPGRAHDGQFFLEDLLWPGIPHVLLPRLDHAQPAVGGHGFDHVRYWLIILSLVLSRSIPDKDP
ncbi:MAG: hypothetical protein M3Y08_15705 [Fibrobacterota bacterium]|nr:hypothetical protein [Fibrobacterota bacterium]